MLLRLIFTILNSYSRPGSSNPLCRTPGRGGPCGFSLALAAPFVDLGNVAETFDSLRQLDKRAERRDARHFPANHIAHLVLLKPIGPDVVHLLDPERKRRGPGRSSAPWLRPCRPFCKLLTGFLIRPVQLMSLMWIRPSIPSSISTNAPNSARLRIRPLTTVPTGYFSAEHLPGIGLRLLHPRAKCAAGPSQRRAPPLQPRRRPSRFSKDALALGPAHLADVDQSFDARLDLHECAVVRHAHDLAAAAFCLGKRSGTDAHGSGSICLRPSEMRPFSLSYFKILTSISSPGDTTSAGSPRVPRTYRSCAAAHRCRRDPRMRRSR